MSKQAIALLQAERDHVASAGMDFGGRLSDEDSSTVAEYDDAIAAVQKLMADRDALLVALRFIANMTMDGMTAADCVVRDRALRIIARATGETA